MAVDLGNFIACANYGNILEYGKGIEENKVKAIKYYKMSANSGDSSKINYIGLLIYKYATNKDSYGMINYGFMLDNGYGTEINHEEAEKLYKTVVDK